MVIGTDMDDTIINSFEDLMPFFADFFHLELEWCKKNNYSYNNFPDNLKDRKQEFINYLEENDLMDNISVKENVREVISRLRKRGHKIIILTSRNNSIISNAYEKCKTYLDTNNIEYDKLFCEHDKHKILIDECIDVFIDDSIKGLNYNKDACKYPILFDSTINKKEKSNYIRVSSWIEVENIIKELNKKKLK